MSTPPDELRTLIADGADQVVFPDRMSERLVERALAEQWDLERDLPWQQMPLADLPQGVRAAMGDVYTQIQYGEVLALRMTERALAHTGEGWARRFCELQIVDEARHVRFFSRVVGQLGEPAPTSAAMVEFAALLEGCETPQEIALAVQVVLEGFAQTVFLEGARRGREAAAIAIRFPHTAIAARFLTSLADYVGKDESRHVAFGVLYLREHLRGLSGVQRRALERKAEQWIGQLMRVAEEVARATATLGIPGAQLRHKVADVQRRHLQQIGLGDLLHLDTSPRSS